jgi:predicted O-methyltransferase YrrM
MNAVLTQIYQTGLVQDAEGNPIRPSASVPQEVGRQLYNLIHAENLENSLEIGMAFGVSTLFMCQAHRDKGSGHHTVIDPYQASLFRSIGVLNVKRAGFEELVNFHQAPSHAILPQLLNEGRSFDFAFVDGSHLYDYVMVDFFYIDKLLQVGGYIVFDDLWMPAIRKVIAYIARNRAYEVLPASSLDQGPPWRRAARIGRRLLQNPLEWDHSGFKLSADKIAILRKVRQDQREWHFHRSF